MNYTNKYVCRLRSSVKAIAFPGWYKLRFEVSGLKVMSIKLLSVLKGNNLCLLLSKSVESQKAISTISTTFVFELSIPVLIQT